MKLEFDFSEFEKFGENLLNQHDLESTMMTATRKIAKVLHGEILKRTPIKTGNLRKMWSAGDNLLFTVDIVKGGYEVTLINEAQNEKGFKYGLAVEDGHKTPNGKGFVTGRFFVKNSIEATEDALKAIILPELQKWFKRC